jgi:hypothetical protein
MSDKQIYTDIRITGEVTATQLTIDSEYSLPTADGTTNQVLATDGAGQVQFVDISSISAPPITISNGAGINWSLVGSNYTGTVTLAPFSTSNLAEGTNLYFTNERVDDRVAALIQNGTGISWSYNDAGNSLTPTVSLAPFTTSNLGEGTNLYFTGQRVFNTLLPAIVNPSPSPTNPIVWQYNAGPKTVLPKVSLDPFDTDDLGEGSTNLYHTTNRAQDAAAGIFTANPGLHTGVSFSYNGATNEMTATVSPIPVEIQCNGVSCGCQSIVNFCEGNDIGLTVSEDLLNNCINVTINSCVATPVIIEGTGTGSAYRVGNCNSALGDYSTVSGGYCGITNDDYSTLAGGCLNSVSGTASSIGGGACNCAVCDYSTVSGGYCGITNDNYSTLAGGCLNSVSGTGSSIGGGACNCASGNSSTVSGGFCNSTGDNFSTIGGGVSNCAVSRCSTVSGGAYNCADLRAFVGGGVCNSASSLYSTVAGGCGNVASCDYSTIGGGLSNSVVNGLAAGIFTGCNNVICDDLLHTSSYSLIGGGQSNVVSGSHSSVGGGSANSATGDYLFIGGGSNNSILDDGSTFSLNSTIVGGDCNSILGASDSSILGGFCNTVCNASSAIVGGSGNVACNYYSGIFGYNITSVADCTFHVNNLAITDLPSTDTCNISVLTRDQSTGIVTTRYFGGLYSQTADGATVTNTTTPTSIVGTGVGTLSVPANGFAVGDSFTARMGGLISTGNGQTLTIDVLSGAVVLGSTGSISLVNGMTNRVWNLDIDFTIRAIGGAGVASILANGFFIYNNTNDVYGADFVSLNNTTFDTTGANTLDIIVTWGAANASNSLTARSFILTKTF